MQSAGVFRSRSSASTRSAARRTRRRSKARRISISPRKCSRTPHLRRRCPRKTRRLRSSAKRRTPATMWIPLRPTKSPKPSLRPKSTSAPLAVAITGGIGAGKSTALEAFARQGAATISSDEIVHRLLRSDPDVRRELVEHFGTDVIGDDGVDRSAIARIVFNDPEELDWLEELLHPRVVREHAAWRAEMTRRSDPPHVT